MKIIFLIPDMGFGGAERVVSILSKEIADRGFSVDIVCLYGDRVQYEISPKVTLLNFSEKNTSKRSRMLNLRYYFKLQKKQYNKVVAVAFQASCLNTAIASAMFTGVKVMATERTNPYKKGNSLIKRIKASIPYVLSDFCVFQTNDARNYYKVIPDRKCAIIGNPITPSKYLWNGNSNPSGLISICRINKAKNLLMSIRVLEKLKPIYPNIHLDVYGTGDSELLDSLILEVERLGVKNNISFKGNTDSVLELLSNHSVFLSTSDYEGISNSMLEAMSVGMPLVCTDCPIGGARMMLSDGCGLLSPVGDVDAFAANVDFVLSHPIESKRMAKLAQEKTLEYSQENISKEWYNIFIKMFEQS